MILQKELVWKRSYWHRECKCTCAFCSPTGCDHGKNPLDGICAQFTCTRCAKHKCPEEWNGAITTWRRSVQRVRKGRGAIWVMEDQEGTRREMIRSMKAEMKSYNSHCKHVLHHKNQMRQLLANFPHNSIIIKGDFIQNILHGCGQETSQTFFNKRQSQLLTFVIWYWQRSEDGTWERCKLYVDYVSSYLSHNSLFFQKCLLHLTNYLRQNLGLVFRKVKVFRMVHQLNSLNIRFGCKLTGAEHISRTVFLFTI